MNILKTSALAAALTGSLCTMTASVTHAQWPNVLEAKAIAEEGFISQFKAPFNQIDNMARVANYKDTAVVTPNSDTKIQAGYKAQPLSAYLKQPAPPAAPAIDFPKADDDDNVLDPPSQ